MADLLLDKILPPELREGGLVSESLLRHCLKRCGRGVRVFQGCRLVSPEAIELGDFCQVDEGVLLFAGEGIAVGRHVHLAAASSISGGGRCVLGDFAGIGVGVRLVTGTEVVDGAGLTNPTVPSSYRAVQRGSVVIGAHAVIFTNSVVLPSVLVGEGAVVAAGSVVHRDLKPWGVYAGNPLVQIGTRPAERILALAEQLLREEGRGAADRPVS
jgi:galactoside O-acetyltransferase